MKIFVGHIKKISVIVKKNGIIGYWSPEMFKIPACPDILSGILIISLTFLGFSLISTIPLDFLGIIILGFTAIR